MPWVGLDFDSRTANTSDSAYRVSPTKTGAGISIRSQPRFAIAFWLVSETLIPKTMERARQEFTMGLANSDCAAYSASKWRGCWFMVRG